jgi:hypothetical protein
MSTVPVVLTLLGPQGTNARTRWLVRLLSPACCGVSLKFRVSERFKAKAAWTAAPGNWGTGEILTPPPRKLCGPGAQGKRWANYLYMMFGENGLEVYEGMVGVTKRRRAVGGHQ